MPEEKKDNRTFIGYVNYNKVEEPNTLKTYYFNNKTRAQVEAIKAQFQTEQYIYLGMKATEEPEKHISYESK